MLTPFPNHCFQKNNYPNVISFLLLVLRTFAFAMQRNAYFFYFKTIHDNNIKTKPINQPTKTKLIESPREFSIQDLYGYLPVL